MVVPELVLERPLGGLVLGDVILERRQRAAQLGVTGLPKMHWVPSSLPLRPGRVGAPHLA